MDNLTFFSLPGLTRVACDCASCGQNVSRASDFKAMHCNLASIIGCITGCDRAPKSGGVAPNPPATLTGPAPANMYKVLERLENCRERPGKPLPTSGGPSNPAGFCRGCHTLPLYCVNAHDYKIDLCCNSTGNMNILQTLRSRAMHMHHGRLPRNDGDSGNAARSTHSSSAEIKLYASACPCLLSKAGLQGQWSPGSCAGARCAVHMR